LKKKLTQLKRSLLPSAFTISVQTLLNTKPAGLSLSSPNPEAWKTEGNRIKKIDDTTDFDSLSLNQTISNVYFFLYYFYLIIFCLREYGNCLFLICLSLFILSI
jgi:hypothetical protein